MNSPTPDSEVAHSEAIKCLRSKGRADGIRDVKAILTALEKLVTPMVQELAEELEAFIIASEEMTKRWDDQIYKYHQFGDEWVIRRHHLNGFEGVGAANGEIEAKSICTGMNACIRLIMWDSGGDDPERLSIAVQAAKRALEPMMPAIANAQEQGERE